jgi:hypothetical protein
MFANMMCIVKVAGGSPEGTIRISVSGRDGLGSGHAGNQYWVGLCPYLESRPARRSLKRARVRPRRVRCESLAMVRV